MVAVAWEEEFERDAALTAMSHREATTFQPWDVSFSVVSVSISSLNRIKSDFEPGGTKTSPQSPGASQRSVVVAPLSPSSGDSVPSGKDEVSVIKVGLRNLKILRDLVSTRRFKKTNCDGSVEKYYVHSDGAEFSCDTDSLDDDLDDAEQDDDLEGSTVRKSFSYGSLQTMNVGALLYAPRIDGDMRVGYITVTEILMLIIMLSKCHPPLLRSMLPSRYGERGAYFRFDGERQNAKGQRRASVEAIWRRGCDDIDYDRRLLTPSDGSVSEVFFASIDQRSERAAGESACTALVAVIADWFQANQDLMPIRSQFDNLIREGSLEWRKLCENETYRERFPDKHFDLDTVLHSKIRPLTVVPSKSFIGFFHPEGTEDLSGFEFLHGAMSFDNIWDEISRAVECSTGKSTLYIVSWNDHFFVLKVDADAYYIIDTLGERLSEGCNQAYILKFDDSTTIHKVPSEKKEENPESSCLKDSSESSSTEQDSGTDTEECELVLKGKDACKEYIKSFLAAIPIRELQADIKKGLMASTPLHHRLQIEFHYTESCPAEITIAWLHFPL
ncbi:hypothetical protein HU200_008959 [Digitaria exilis]|uniref:C2 NT-type domain-containing protein n=1 Tax=Digitaria exilis TaxID=1010633 RepID=A0A835FLL7_9POAL|nr:hypothetical protein HU200_008959 [Digitaria exilis]